MTLRAWTAAFHFGDPREYRKTWYELRKSIKKAKRQYKKVYKSKRWSHVTVTTTPGTCVEWANSHHRLQGKGL